MHILRGRKNCIISWDFLGRKARTGQNPTWSRIGLSVFRVRASGSGCYHGEGVELRKTSFPELFELPSSAKGRNALAFLSACLNRPKWGRSKLGLESSQQRFLKMETDSLILFKKLNLADSLLYSILLSNSPSQLWENSGSLYPEETKSKMSGLMILAHISIRFKRQDYGIKLHLILNKRSFPYHQSQ